VTSVPSCSNDISSVANRTSRHRVPLPGPEIGSPSCPGRSLRTPRDWQGQGQMNYLPPRRFRHIPRRLGSRRGSARGHTDRCSHSSPPADGGLQSDLAKQLDHVRHQPAHGRRCMSRSGWRSTTTHGAHPAPPTTRRWTGQSAPPTTSTWVLCRRTSVSLFPVVAHAVLDDWCSAGGLRFYQSTQDIHIYKKPQPVLWPEHYCHYSAESTKHHHPC
jgi:hypothetical protein